VPIIERIKTLGLWTLRADLIAGVTVALVLIPQSMANAQLAGLPPYYGLYSAFLPPMIGVIFGSSRQLATGPVAVVSLLSAAAVGQFAPIGSETFIAYSILLALIVGSIQLALGTLRLGVLVNFIAHPVIVGFTNSAAIIIATSQLAKVFGVYEDKAEHHYRTVFNVLWSALEFTHLPTLLMSLAAFLSMFLIKRFAPRLPGVLIVVTLATLLSWTTGYEKSRTIKLSDIQSTEAAGFIRDYNASVAAVAEMSSEKAAIITRMGERGETSKKAGRDSLDALALRYKADRFSLLIEESKKNAGVLKKKISRSPLWAVEEEGGRFLYYKKGEPPEKKFSDRHIWRIKTGTGVLDENALTLTGGGAVLGDVPAGLPGLALPHVRLDIVLALFPQALIISLMGFMESISIAKAMAARTGLHLDPNRELIGQGLANIVGSVNNGYTVSGSFSSSAVNFQAGARTATAGVFTGLMVGLTLMFLTPALYNVPQGVLASVVMLAVVGLINVKGFLHLWKAQKHDGVTAAITFCGTLAFAPHLDKGIMAGVVFSLGHYLYRHMRPRVVMLGRHPDGSLRDAELYKLARCRHIALIEYDGSLFFANTSYLEDQVLERIAAKPELRRVIIFGEGINELDASGEETIAVLLERLRGRGMNISFVGLKQQVVETIKRTGLYEKIGPENFFQSGDEALQAVHRAAHENSSEERCPLMGEGY
jgi:MFS superfamily sulfate permease-like transporter